MTTKAPAKTAKKKVTKKVATKATDTAEKKVKKKRVTKAEREAQEEVVRLHEKWTELHGLFQDQPAQKYKMTDAYEASVALKHPKFGWGYVLTSENNRLDVLFEEGIKSLISNYK